jgi:anti-sigma factor RsiW
MNHDSQLKLQAYVDGELSPRQTHRVEAWLAEDSEARQLVAELRTVKQALAGNEPEVQFAGSRDFYWSGIQRRIEASERAVTAASDGPVWASAAFWRRWLTPIASVAVVVAVAIGTARFFVPEESFSHIAEVEDVAEETSSFSFRSPSENMFVVWVSDRSLTEEAPAPVEDEIAFQ